jgi:hypothetical protein
MARLIVTTMALAYTFSVLAFAGLVLGPESWAYTITQFVFGLR